MSGREWLWYWPRLNADHPDGEHQEETMSEREWQPKVVTTQQKADVGLAILDAQADAWAEEVDLTSIIKNATSPMRLSKIAPDEVRREFADRMEQQVYAIARQAFIEGMTRAPPTGSGSERE